MEAGGTSRVSFWGVCTAASTRAAEQWLKGFKWGTPAARRGLQPCAGRCPDGGDVVTSMTAGGGARCLLATLRLEARPLPNGSSFSRCFPPAALAPTESTQPPRGAVVTLRTCWPEPLNPKRSSRPTLVATQQPERTCWNVSPVVSPFGLRPCNSLILLRKSRSLHHGLKRPCATQAASTSPTLPPWSLGSSHAGFSVPQMAGTLPPRALALTFPLPGACFPGVTYLQSGYLLREATLTTVFTINTPPSLCSGCSCLAPLSPHST